MKFYDVFNGDADGLCALLQLRLVHPREAILVTGVKRDIRLLQRVDAKAGDDIVVLDVSLAANRTALSTALEAGARVSWFDHHQPGEIPEHPALIAHIDTDPYICTSLIVDRHLGGQFRSWASVAAFGDNLVQPAIDAAHNAGLSSAETGLMRELGTCLNYNAYGDTVADLIYPPADLFHEMLNYSDPRDFVRDTDIFSSLREGMSTDIERSDAIELKTLGPGSRYAVLPEAAWSRRVVGVYANRLAQRDPGSAHAVLVEKQGGYLVSIRAPAERPRGAVRVATEFHSGGGREGAAGIDLLPTNELERFLDAMRTTFDAHE